jgi:hypothetical protein
VDVLVAAVDEGDDQRVEHAPASGLGVGHEAEPPEVDLGELARRHVGHAQTVIRRASAKPQCFVANRWSEL